MKRTSTSPSPDALKRNATRAEGLLKELANARRLMILCSLTSGEKTVRELAEASDLSQSAVSQHLSRLREAGMVAADKRGQSVYYRIQSMEAQALISMLYLMYCKP